MATEGTFLFLFLPLLPQSHVEGLMEGACVGTLQGLTADSAGVELGSLLLLEVENSPDLLTNC